MLLYNNYLNVLIILRLIYIVNLYTISFKVYQCTLVYPTEFTINLFIYFMYTDVQFIAFFQEIKKLKEPDTEHVKEFHKKEVNEERKPEKSLLEIHQSKIAKKKKVIWFFFSYFSNYAIYLIIKSILLIYLFT